MVSKSWVVLASLGGCRKLPQTGQLKQETFLTVLEAGRPRAGIGIVRFLWEPSSALQTAGCSVYPHMVAERGWSGSPASSFKGVTPSMKAPLSWPSHLPEAPPPNTSKVRVDCYIMNFGGNNPDVQFIALGLFRRIQCVVSIWFLEHELAHIKKQTLTWYCMTFFCSRLKPEFTL